MNDEARQPLYDDSKPSVRRYDDKSGGVPTYRGVGFCVRIFTIAGFFSMVAAIITTLLLLIVIADQGLGAAALSAFGAAVAFLLASASWFGAAFALDMFRDLVWHLMKNN